MIPAGVLGVSGGAIDVHTHYLPPSYRSALEGGGRRLPDNIPALPPWDATSMLAGMDRLGIATAMLSISSPGILMTTQAETVALARTVNNDGAEVVRTSPRRFGLLASLPLPHVDDALAEVDRAYGDLEVDGVVLMTNYGGRYVGHPDFAAVLEELDRRQAVVLLHPVAPPNHDLVSFGRPIPMLEFPFDTTRAVVDLVLSGATQRFPRIRWIVPHAGAALPVLAQRVAWVTSIFNSEGAGIDVLAELRRLHYDVAGAALPVLLPALIALAGSERLLYGSDMTFTPVSAVVKLAEGLRETTALDDDERAAMLRTTAEPLFPRVSAASQPATKAAGQASTVRVADAPQDTP